MTVISTLLVKLGVDNSDIGPSMLKSGKLMAAGAVVAGAAATKALYEIGSTFDEVEDSIRIGTGKTGEALDSLTGSAEKVATSIPTSFQEAGATVTDLNNRLDLTGPTLEKLTKQILESGRMTGQAIDVKTLTGAFNAFEVKGAQTTKVMDDIFRVSQATGVGMNDLATMVGTNAPVLKQFGFGISDSVALLGNLDKAGLPANKTVATLSRAMVTFAKEGREPKKALADTISGIEGFIKAGDQAGAVNLAAEIFGTRGASQFVAAVKAGKVNLDDLMGSTGATSDTILKASRDTQDFSEKWDIFKNRVMLKLKPVAMAVFDAIGTGMDKISKSDALDDVSASAAQLGGFLKTNLLPPLSMVVSVLVGSVLPASTAVIDTLVRWQNVIVPIAAGIGTIVVAFKAYQATMAIVSAVTKAYTAVQAALNIVLAMNPVVLIVLALVALGVALVVAYKKSETFRDIVNGAFDMVKSVASAVVSFFTDKVPAAFHKIMDAAGSVLGWVKSNWQTILAIITGPIGLAVLFIVRNWDKISAVTQMAWNKVKSVTSAVWGAITGYIRAQIHTALAVINGVSKVPGIVKDAFESARQAVVDKLKAVVTLAKGLPGRVIDGLGDLGSKLLNAGEDLIEGFLQGIRNKFDDVKDTLGDLTGKLTSWKGPPSHDATLLKPAGESIIDGLVDGIENRFDKVEATLTRLTDRISKLVDDKAISKAAGAGAQKLVDVYDKKLGKLTRRYEAWKARLDKEQSTLDQMVNDRASMASGLAGSLAGELDLGSVVTDSPFGFGARTTFAAVAGAVAGIAARVRNFANKLRALLKAGIPKGLVQEVAGLGSVKGTAVADALLSGSAEQVRQLAVDYSSLTDSAAVAGDVLAGAFFDAGIAAQQGIIDGLLSEGAGLDAAIEALGDKIVKKLKKKFKIHSPSELMADEIGVPSGEGVGVGFIGGLDSAQSDIDARISSLAQVPSFGSASLTGGGTAASGGSTGGLSESEVLAMVERMLASVGIDVHLGVDDRTSARMYIKGKKHAEAMA